MSWSIGFDAQWQRDIGYGVPAYCDQPGCNAEIDRGLAHVCGSEPKGGTRGCGLYFCGAHMKHHRLVQLCERCGPVKLAPFERKPDHPDWVQHKLTDESWAAWRADNPEWVECIVEGK